MATTPSRPDIPKLLRDGFAALNDARLDAAEAACRRVLAVDPKCAPAHFLVGLIAIERKDTKTAIGAFGSVTRLQSNHVAAWGQLARLLLQVDNPGDAEDAMRRALALGSTDPIVQDLLGVVCALWGDQFAANEWFRRAAGARPDVAQYQLNLANNLVVLGRDSEARAALNAALAADPNNPQAHWMLANARIATSTQHIDELERLCSAYAGQPQAAAFLAYAAGKEHEDLEQWGEAFAAFARGAAAKRSTIKYDEQAEAQLFDALIETFTPQWCARKTAGCPDEAPIFVIGEPRTGTTLIERIISSHSQVHSAGELQQFAMALRRTVNVAAPGRYSAQIVRAAANVDVEALGQSYLAAVKHQRGVRSRFVDKLPINYLYLGLIAKALPNARIVHVVRDPIDSCFASFKQLFADAYYHSYDQLEMARHHVRYRRLMDHWRSALPGRFIDVAYEEVVTDLETQARRVIDYLELPWEDACLNFHNNVAAVTTASAIQVREPVYRRSVARWRCYETQLRPTIETLQSAGLVR
jgi:cytochrome c-type biogenesis protein CcmH/NrfG